MNRPFYILQGWQGTLFVIVVIFIVFNINIWKTKTLSFLQNILFALHVFDFFAVVIVLWIVTQIQSTEIIFILFKNNNEWNLINLNIIMILIFWIIFFIHSAFFYVQWDRDQCYSASTASFFGDYYQQWRFCLTPNLRICSWSRFVIFSMNISCKSMFVIVFIVFSSKDKNTRQKLRHEIFHDLWSCR